MAELEVVHEWLEPTDLPGVVAKLSVYSNGVVYRDRGGEREHLIFDSAAGLEIVRLAYRNRYLEQANARLESDLIRREGDVERLERRK